MENNIPEEMKKTIVDAISESVEVKNKLLSDWSHFLPVD